MERPVYSRVFVLLAIFALAGCAAGPRSGGDSGANAVRVMQDQEWILQDIEGEAVIADLNAGIRFAEDGRVAGRAGCNVLAGQAAIEGDSLELGPIITTKRACLPPVMDQEDRFLAALDRVEGWRLDDGSLYLLDGGGDALLRFSAAD